MSIPVFKHIFSIVKAECFVWATVVQLFSFIRIDMVHHQSNILLCQLIETASFWQDTTYQFMVDFTGSFLIRSPWIAIKYLCSIAWNGATFFDFLWI